MQNEQHTITSSIPKKIYTLASGENRKANAKPKSMHVCSQFNDLIIKPSVFYFNEHTIRVSFDENDQPLFCLDDAYKALNIKKRANSNNYKFDPKGIHHLSKATTNNNQFMTFISEENLYRIVFRSRKVEAYSFQHWLLNDLMPKIRKKVNYADTIKLKTYQELNHICMDDFKSKERSTVHSYGLQRRKLEKRLNALKMKICIANLQLALEGI